MRAAARTIAIVCGTTMSSPPVMSRTPSSDWSVGSWIGVAAQLQRCTERRKCSAPMTLDGLVEGQGHAGCVGAGEPLVPVAALDEADRLGPAQHARGAAHPQQLPGGVGDGHDGVAVPRGLAEHVVEEGEDLGQRVRLAVVAQGVGRQRDRAPRPGRLDTGGRRAQPRVGDLGADGGQWIHRASMRVAGRPVQRRLTPAPDGQARRRGVGSTKRVSPATCGR